MSEAERILLTELEKLGAEREKDIKDFGIVLNQLQKQYEQALESNKLLTQKVEYLGKQVISLMAELKKK